MWWLPLNAMCTSLGCGDRGPVHVAQMGGVRGVQREQDQSGLGQHENQVPLVEP